ncbi:hypothetical protein B0H66DRAFT_565949 [Apodospora peruviana]|uniref:NAD(P)-binding domain-containing protein n=1 Tax=Apodospora peruviana TaxID=516989 RepID=A0AAE0HUY2_9PEZI|nr:hypothetical protein B0H66DRAFT_565949 [Apodospora peruviana]
MSTSTKTVLFLGATGGVCLSALRRSLAAGHTCIALCRTPSKLTNQLTTAETSSPNLLIEQGNAQDVDSLVRCLTKTASVDTVLSSIGGAFSISKMNIDDPKTCEVGMNALVEAIRRTKLHPHIIAVSSTGISDAGRDIPLPMVPLYHVLLKAPHKDKKNMETALIKSGEPRWTIVRPSFYTDGPETDGQVRAGVEDLAGQPKFESKAIGYSISRLDVGKWIFENLLRAGEADVRKYTQKAVMITY